MDDSRRLFTQSLRGMKDSQLNTESGEYRRSRLSVEEAGGGDGNRAKTSEEERRRAKRSEDERRGAKRSEEERSRRSAWPNSPAPLKDECAGVSDL
ncbi:hypothetical protein EYF80_036081 [Liparis tanakae]|uniref:Uncharacterized protein n=1 Tax=Liparis tanakae TaxID=230148 RepID=A0A4Z2GK81_9TELE|nr:hypothetical protein EYF80_036081 [Liparis tanakae]